MRTIFIFETTLITIKIVICIAKTSKEFLQWYTGDSTRGNDHTSSFNPWRLKADSSAGIGILRQFGTHADYVGVAFVTSASELQKSYGLNCSSLHRQESWPSLANLETARKPEELFTSWTLQKVPDNIFPGCVFSEPPSTLGLPRCPRRQNHGLPALPWRIFTCSGSGTSIDDLGLADATVRRESLIGPRKDACRC